MQSKYTIGRDPIVNGYHVGIIKDKLTRTLGTILPDVIDELTAAVQEYIPVQGDGTSDALAIVAFMIADDDDFPEWVTVNAMQTSQMVVARASNRVFVGLPLCTFADSYQFVCHIGNVGEGRKGEWLDLAIRVTLEVIWNKNIINLFPSCLKGYVGFHVTALSEH